MRRSVHYRELAGQCLRWTSNIAVLALLLAVVYFGHHYQWQLPKFSEFASLDNSESDVTVRSPSMPVQAAASQTGNGLSSIDESVDDCSESEGVRSVQTFKPENRVFDLPAINFASRREVERAGIEFSGVELCTMDEFVTANGTVDYDHTRMARLSTRVSGIIWRVEKCVGEPVKKGELLALIDSADVGRAKAEYLDALVQCKLKEQTFKRLGSLQDVIAGRRLPQAEADWRASRIHRINAEQSLITMGLPVDFDGDSHSFDDQLVSRIHQLGLPKALLESIGSETQSANLLPLVSPLDGVVIRRNVVRGEVVQSSQTLFTVADVSRMWVHLNVRTEEVHTVGVGQEVLVSDDGIMRDHIGEITWVSTEVDPTTRTVRLRAELPNPCMMHDGAEPMGHRLLHANAYVSAKIRIRSNPQTLAVPSSAVRCYWKDACQVVFLPIKGGIALQPHRVKLGVKRNGYTEIVSGLNPTDSVAIAGTRLLQLELVALSELEEPDELHKSAVARNGHD
jgi:cobalt-zinc-cadmium efflux system membrane fusion protein